MPVPTGPIFPLRKPREFLRLLADVLIATLIVALAGAALYILALLTTHPQWASAAPGTATIDPCRTQWTEDARFVSPCDPTPDKDQTDERTEQQRP